MTSRKRRWRRRLLVAAGCLLVFLLSTGLYLRSYAKPTIRADIANPLYTVGDANYAAALSEGKRVVKFGRLPLGIYPGGIAFNDPLKAGEYLEEIGKADEGWKVYLLSGDFQLDSAPAGDGRYTNKSLEVLKAIDAP